jgi:2-polyprenyl-3-methyl-5-hydroxy-6-metoxy-1,4-benzoquinol methylase
VRSEDLLNDVELESTKRRYSTFRTPTLGYATVADYCDSCDNLRSISGYMNDLKDVQRCWALKAILGHVPTGSRLIEIGAGEPVIAHILHRAGYEVTVVDPYEGAGNGPTQVARFKKTFDGVNFVVELFNEFTLGLEPGGYDACYSISVIEHVPIPALGEVFAGVKKFVKPQGLSIHAIDDVVLGPGDSYHADMLKAVALAHGLDEDQIDELHLRIQTDPETYFLSAEGHNRWRGLTPYAEFPMRRCISVQMVQSVGAMA